MEQCEVQGVGGWENQCTNWRNAEPSTIDANSWSLYSISTDLNIVWRSAELGLPLNPETRSLPVYPFTALLPSSPVLFVFKAVFPHDVSKEPHLPLCHTRSHQTRHYFVLHPLVLLPLHWSHHEQSSSSITPLFKCSNASCGRQKEKSNLNSLNVKSVLRSNAELTVANENMNSQSLCNEGICVYKGGMYVTELDRNVGRDVSVREQYVCVRKGSAWVREVFIEEGN